MSIHDRCGRQIDYLRVSVTDRCNLRCRYCLPADGLKLASPAQVLSYEEIERVVRVACGLGIRRVRLTGGEPLVRRELERLIGKLSAIPGLTDLSLTTNGILLADRAASLKEAGLHRVNISLDSLDPERYRWLTRRGRLGQVLAGAEAALAAGLDPVKLNVVALPDDGEALIPLAEMSITRPLHVRFIELMPCPSARTGWQGLLSCEQILERLRRLGELSPAPAPAGGGPARYYRYPGARGTIGVIAAISGPFCSQCNRLRLNSVGRLHPCLFSGEGVDLRAILRSGGGEHQIARAIEQAAQCKPDGYPEHLGSATESLCLIGG